MVDDDSKLSADARAIIRVIENTRSGTRRDIACLLDEQRKIRSEVEMVKAGFPGGDPAKHRAMHEAQIEWQELRNKIVRDSLVSAGKAGFFGGIAWLAYAAWVALKMEFHR